MIPVRRVEEPVRHTSRVPWYERTLRWGQTNLTEIDPERYDHGHWERQWEATAIEGLVVNAGGIVAYYPSDVPLHARSPYLGDRDLFGEIVERAKARSLTVVARMDCNRAGEDFYLEHPEWFAVREDGSPYRSSDKYIACIHGPYYDEHIPQILSEVIDRYAPDGFADNSWSGLGRSHICYCRHCRESFASRAGSTLPRSHDWDDPEYREWIEWNYARRIEVWDSFNAVTMQAGGTDCRWIGMNSAQMGHQAESFRDLGRLAKRTPLLFIDHQRRDVRTGFQANSRTGKLVTDLMSGRGRAAESMAMYNHGGHSFRLASAPEPEARMWAVSGIAGGLLPWWHHIGAAHEDRRQFATAPPLWTWHARNAEFLIDRTQVANVGVLWSQRSHDYFGRAQGRLVAEDPYDGMVDALLRERIEHRPVHESRLAEVLPELDVLILPNVGALSEPDAALITRFVERGGGLVATGESSLFDETGERRDDFALAPLFGVSALHRHQGERRPPEVSWETSPAHTYLQLTGSSSQRHPVVGGFDGTDQLPFGGRLEEVELRGGEPLATFVEPFPVYPPETSWQRSPATTSPAVVHHEPGSGRVVYIAADLDRCFGRGAQPDHARLIGNAVRWAGRGRRSVTCSGHGTVDLHLYRQGERYIMHLVNFSGSGAWRMPMHEDIPIGPLTVTIDRSVAEPGCAWPGELESMALVSGEDLDVRSSGALLQIDVPRLVDHEVLVVTPIR